MYSQITTAINHGMEALPVHVEADISDGMPRFEMVGFLSSEVKEARERVKTALRNSGFFLPAKRITINLTPADVRKSGNSCDFPVAAALLAAMGFVDERLLRDYLILGEVGLNGRILPVRGILSAAMMAKEQGFRGIIVPKKNGAEAAIFPDIKVIAVETISEFVECCQGNLEAHIFKQMDVQEWEPHYDVDFSEVLGQELLVRACEIAVSGMHNLLMIGPPGSGKTMAAKRIPTILPELTKEEQLELSQVYSLAGLLDESHILQRERPFRSPHHTSTRPAICGGGKYPKPGEISLAHKGVLFLDELPEFSRGVLEALREPLEDKRIHISRAEASYTYPADVLLVASMNPCQCGFYPDMNRCTCTPASLQQYINRVSQALLNRIDMSVQTNSVPFAGLRQKKTAESSEEIRKRVERVHKLQHERYRDRGYLFNSQIRDDDMDRFCFLTPALEEWMRQQYENYQLTPRSFHKMLRVARTIADLDGQALIQEKHLVEALGYRGANLLYWRRA